MDIEVPAACRKCDEPATPKTMPFCAACYGEAEHLCALFSDSEGLHFCGCGCPDEAYELVRDILALAPFYDHPEAVRELTGDRAYYLVLYAIDNAGLLEHGASIGGSWLTPKGAHYLELMRKFDHDDLDHVGLPHYGDDGRGDGECGPGCPHWEASTEDYRKDEIRRQAAEQKAAGDWQVIVPNAWTALEGADVSVLVKSKTLIKTRAPRLAATPAR